MVDLLQVRKKPAQVMCAGESRNILELQSYIAGAFIQWIDQTQKGAIR